MSNTTFDRPDLSAFARLDGLGLEVRGQRMWPDHAVLACRIVGEDRWCRRCGCQGVARDTVVRALRVAPHDRARERSAATGAQSVLTCGART